MGSHNKPQPRQTKANPCQNQNPNRTKRNLIETTPYQNHTKPNQSSQPNHTKPTPKTKPTHKTTTKTKTLQKPETNQTKAKQNRTKPNQNRTKPHDPSFDHCDLCDD